MYFLIFALRVYVFQVFFFILTRSSLRLTKRYISQALNFAVYQNKEEEFKFQLYNIHIPSLKCLHS